MEGLQPRSADPNSVKTKALEDAKLMYQKVLSECKKADKTPPPYTLVELIGKGSFGRVYKGSLAPQYTLHPSHVPNWLTIDTDVT